MPRCRRPQSAAANQGSSKDPASPVVTPLWLDLFFGRQEWLYTHQKNHPLKLFLVSILRAGGQVYFANNACAGFLIFLAVFLQDAWLGTMALVGTTSAQLFAYSVLKDKTSVLQGVIGYNGFLVGCIVANGIQQHSIAVLIVVVAASSLSMLLDLAFAPKVFTFPFNLIGLATVFAMKTLPLFDAAVTSETSTEVSPVTVMNAVVYGVGQVVFCNQVDTSLLVVLGLAFYSPIGAVTSLFSSAAGLGLAFAFQATDESILQGLWGYNPVLAGMLIPMVFDTHVILLVYWVFAIVLVILVQAFMQPLLASWGVGTGTLPFCLTGLVMTAAAAKMTLLTRNKARVPEYQVFTWLKTRSVPPPLVVELMESGTLVLEVPGDQPNYVSLPVPPPSAFSDDENTDYSTEEDEEEEQEEQPGGKEEEREAADKTETQTLEETEVEYSTATS